MTAPPICARCDTVAPRDADWPLHTSGMTGKTYHVCPSCEGDTPGNSTRTGDANASDNQLKLFVERIERLEEEERGLKDDKRDTYSELRAQGYDAKITREIVRLRRMSPHDLAERDAILDTYRAAIGLG